MPLVEWAFETDNRAAWSGYFTTHPFGKRAFRTFGELFRGLRGIAAVFRYTSPECTRQAISNGNEVEWVVAGNMHHDTITGTSKDLVANHYLVRHEALLRSARLDWKQLVSILTEVEGSSNNRLPDEIWAEFTTAYYKEIINDKFKERESKSVSKDGWDIKFAAPIDEGWSVAETWQTKESYSFMILNQAHGASRLVRIVSKMSSLVVKMGNDVLATCVSLLDSDLFEHIFVIHLRPMQVAMLDISRGQYEKEITFKDLTSQTINFNNQIGIECSFSEGLLTVTD